MSEKLCRNCEHSHRALISGWGYARCKRPGNLALDMVAGKKHRFIGPVLCGHQRLHIGSKCCGPEGKWFIQSEKPAWIKLWDVPR